MRSDPGNLDPQASAATALYQVTQFAYDPLLSIDAKGKIGSELATKWTVTDDTVTLTLHRGITCADGSTFTAIDAADNINWVGDPKNASPFLGAFLPAGITATATGAATVTLKLSTPAPFVLNGLAGLPMVCGSAIKDRSALANATNGTGPYTLTKAAQGDQYTYAVRKGYTWGPDGATTAIAGLPAKIVVKIIPNETTAANLLQSKELNAATIAGADSARLTKAKLFSSKSTGVVGEMWFNHAKDRPGSDPAVRKALVQSLDLGQLAKVLTSGLGSKSTTFAVSEPVACPGNSVAAALPAHKASSAGKLLDAAGWKLDTDKLRKKNGAPLAVTFVHDSAAGAGGSAAAELAVQQWTALGVTVDSKAQDGTSIGETLFSTGNWDIAWEALNVSSPDQLMSFMSGTAAPDGTNFAHIDNAEYLAGVAAAAKVPGTKGCSKWLDAESKLVQNADVIPFANQVALTFGSGATFETNGQLSPTSIRMLGN
jgi:peptide/nickel transport system substrate-binding protein